MPKNIYADGFSCKIPQSAYFKKLNKEIRKKNIQLNKSYFIQCFSFCLFDCTFYIVHKNKIFTCLALVCKRHERKKRRA